MVPVSINNSEVDIVIGATQCDLTSFMNEWKPIFSQFHLIIVKDPGLTGRLKVPEGFNVDVYEKSDMERLAGPSAVVLFSGYSCKYFGFLVSKKKYIVSIDDNCTPAKDSNGLLVDAVAQHVTNLGTPATPFFFNTLYDPYRKGTDFVRGYPFTLRSGVPCALSCGLWMNIADPKAKSHYVDAVLTIPANVMMPLSSINISFDRRTIGPAVIPAFRLPGTGKVSWKTMENIWSGMCAKTVADHLGVGVKSGLPYVLNKNKPDAIDISKEDPEGVQLMEKVIPFFQSLKLSKDASTAEDCILEIAKATKEQLGRSHPVFVRAADAMTEWIKLWKKVGLASSA